MKGFETLSDQLHKGDDAHILRRVSLVRRHGRIEYESGQQAKDLQAVAFQFDSFFFNMVCRAEFDQVEVLVDEQIRWPDMVVSDISEKPPWQGIVGEYFLGDFWEMKNHKGYNDAMQIKFMSVDRTCTSEHIFQFEAAASHFYISRVDEAAWSYNPFAHYPDG